MAVAVAVGIVGGVFVYCIRGPLLLWWLRWLLLR